MFVDIQCLLMVKMKDLIWNGVNVIVISSSDRGGVSSISVKENKQEIE